MLTETQRLGRVSDYQAEVEVTPSQAETAVTEAGEFVEAVEGLVSKSGEDRMP